MEDIVALKKCKECDNEVSSKAKTCPHCGSPIKKNIGCLGAIGVIFLILIGSSFIAIMMSDTSNTPSTSVKSAAPKVYKMKETASVGYTSYSVWEAWWQDRLSTNQFLDEKPNASYLFVDLTVRNDDKKARTVPPFKLVDENGAEYDASSKAWAVENAIGMIENLNPSVSKKGVIVFDVPKNHKYKLRISGGYWSAEDAYILIVTK